MYKLCENVAPDIFRHAGPSCAVTGKCSEGKMTCGKAEEVRDRFENIRLSNALDRFEEDN
jgi:thymidylate synthase (FAD)